MKKKEKYCALCRCTDHSDMPKDLKRNWLCPILGAKICAVDCIYEVAGGMGAPDTLRQVSKTTGKRPQEIHAICVRCKHGGKWLDRAHKIVSITDKDGKETSSGPEFEKVCREAKEADERVLRWLRGDFPKSVIRRMNIERGYIP